MKIDAKVKRKQYRSQAMRYFGAAMNLQHLDEHDEKSCLELLKTADLAELWNALLSVQTELFSLRRLT